MELSDTVNECVAIKKEFETSLENLPDLRESSSSTPTTPKKERSEIYKHKYKAIRTYFHRIQRENCELREKLLRCEKCIDRLQMKRVIYMKRLDYHNDEYRSLKRRYVLLDKNELYLPSNKR